MSADKKRALQCPVCPDGSELQVLDPQLLRLPLQRCHRCQGVLADPTAIALAATYYAASHDVMRMGNGRHHCRHCEALFESVRERCAVCLKQQTLSCVRCALPMQMMAVAGVSIDVCQPCRVVWFDRGELGLLTRRHATALQRGVAHETRTASERVADAAATALFDGDLLGRILRAIEL